jgi:thiamine biosynthesis lipoprotein
VLGPEAGGRLVAQWPGCSVRFVGKA